MYRIVLPSIGESQRTWLDRYEREIDRVSRRFFPLLRIERKLNLGDSICIPNGARCPETEMLTVDKAICISRIVPDSEIRVGLSAIRLARIVGKFLVDKVRKELPSDLPPHKTFLVTTILALRAKRIPGKSHRFTIVQIWGYARHDLRP